jgi:CRISPR system Cascade subunit CasC
MKHLELHILQSVPVSCLNRDDLNSPKTAIFGGVQRARVSSQSWKRAIRELAASSENDASSFFKGKRSRLFVAQIVERLKAKLSPDEATALASCAGHYLAKLDPKQEGKVKTLVFLSPQEYDTLAQMLLGLDSDDKANLLDAYSRTDRAQLGEDDQDDDGAEEEVSAPKAKADKKLSPKQFTKVVAKVLSGPVRESFKAKPMPKDAADIAVFGRMVANDHSLTVEAASMFSHALSVHKVDNEIDFFSAVDDLQGKDEAGAGMTSTLEFNSATYYRFAALNLGMLADKDHLGALSSEERKSVVRTFVESTIKAMPGARKNTMNGNTLPFYVLAVVREQGHPIQLVNAFESSIHSSKGYAAEAVRLLKAEYAQLKTTWGIDAVCEKAVPEIGLLALLDEIVSHVN